MGIGEGSVASSVCGWLLGDNLRLDREVVDNDGYYGIMRDWIERQWMRRHGKEVSTDWDWAKTRWLRVDKDGY